MQMVVQLPKNLPLWDAVERCRLSTPRPLTIFPLEISETPATLNAPTGTVDKSSHNDCNPLNLVILCPGFGLAFRPLH